MDTFISVKAYGADSEKACSAASARIRELEDLFSVTKPDSDISRINAAGGAPVRVSADTADIISEALKLCESTGGALDITIYPALLEWGFTTGEYKIPDEAAIAAALEKVDYRSVSLEGDTVSVPAGAMLDLGSCAKGCASGEMLTAMEKLGITSALVNLGGNVQALGTKPDGSEWTVGIADPFSPNELFGTLKIHDKAVITSGGYQRYFTGEDGHVYKHIIDPATGCPAESGLASVTVIGEYGLKCDALSTALFVMGKEKAASYWRENGGFDMIIVTENGETVVTEGIADNFKPLYAPVTEVLYE